jgi:hypothetical protein
MTERVISVDSARRAKRLRSPKQETCPSCGDCRAFRARADRESEQRGQ